ncbi:MAG: hypothetical protein EXR62_07640 [Chloroflexi bacterium]|nr:hypothetical protein [Chloroflexota bacterium]
MKGNTSTFNGRVRPKKTEPSIADLVKLPLQRQAFVYQRLSSHEQIKKSVYSLAMQDGLENLAKEEGYPEESIIVERRDLGISGTFGQEKREGLAHLIHCIETDEIESIYVVHASRLFRDQTLIDGFAFAELCKQHGIIIVMPNMRLNLRDKMHMRMFRMELERAADELELMSLRLGGARELKAKQGRYAAGSMSVGYVLDTNEDSLTHDKYLLYEPHAAIVRQIFALFPHFGYSPLRLSRHFHREGIRIPFFPPEFQYMETRSAVLQMNKTDTGYLITKKFIIRALTNPTYIGWWIWAGEVISKDNHPKIIAEETFWHMQEKVSISKPKGKAAYSEPMMLQGLLFCTNHENAIQMISSRHDSRYRCNNQSHLGIYDGLCFTVTKEVLDIPISEFIISQCSYAGYATTIIEQLKQGYDAAKEKADANKREHARLTREIETLKENLAQTKTQQQVSMILAMIEERMQERERLKDIRSYPAGRVGEVLHFDKVADFLSNIATIWPTQPDSLKNEFLKIVLDRILIRHEETSIYARIVWKTGVEQQILIQRPFKPMQKEDIWTEEESEWFRQYYKTAAWPDIMRRFSNRSYHSIISRARDLGLGRGGKPPGNGKRWSEKDDAIVKRFLDGEITAEEAIILLERSPFAFFHHLRWHGIYQSKFTHWKERIVWSVVDITEGPQGHLS